MWRILRFLITGDWHLHFWEQVREIEVYRTYAGGHKRQSTQYTLRCKHCGNIKFTED